MALHLTIARPYAKAAFAEAEKTDQFEPWSVVLKAFSKIIKNKEIAELILNPKISDKEIRELLLDLVREITPDATEIIKEKVEHFLQLLIDEKRLTILPDIVLLYHRLLNEYRGMVEAEVISAFPLSESQRDQIQKKLEKRFDAKVKLKITEDESLLGGAIIRAGNWVMDGSVKGKLNRLAESLKR